MGHIRKKPVIGILGGIGSGKTSAAVEFARLGCAVIDADKIAHELLKTDAIKDRIVSAFGSIILDWHGEIDRKKLADIVFAEPEQLGRLNDIIHPEVLRRADQQIELYNGQEGIPAVVLDMALLAEVGWDKRCNELIFVNCDEKNRLWRAKKRGIDEKQLKIREKFQISLDKKMKTAHYIVDNNSDVLTLAEQISSIFSCIINNG